MQEDHGIFIFSLSILPTSLRGTSHFGAQKFGEKACWVLQTYKAASTYIHREYIVCKQPK